MDSPRHIFHMPVPIEGVLLTVMGAGLLTSALRADELVLGSEGVSQYCIVQADQATEPEKFAVQELATHLGRVTGAAFPVVAEPALPAGRPGVYVGWTRYAARRGVDVARLGEEEWVVRHIGNDLVLTGGRPRGTLYAVYEFMERQVGCHWLAGDTDVVPATPTLALPKLDLQGKPVMWSRDINLAFYPMEVLAEDMRQKNRLFEVRNRQNGWSRRHEGGPNGCYRLVSPPEGCHTFSFYVNAAQWLATHPEYFSLNAAGERVPAKDGSGPGQLCLTHPDVRRLTLESLRRLIVKDGAEAAPKG